MLESVEAEKLLSALSTRDSDLNSVEQPTPYLPLSGTWESFLDDRSRNFRRTVKRKESAAAESSITVRRIPCPSIDDLKATVHEVSRLSWQGQNGLAVASTPQGRTFYDALLASSGEFTIDLIAAYKDERCVAYLLGIVHGRVYHAFDTGFDPAYAEQSPGLLLHFHLLRELFGSGLTEFNFGFGHSYKERFEPLYGPAVELRVHRTSLAARLGRLVTTAKKALGRE